MSAPDMHDSELSDPKITAPLGFGDSCKLAVLNGAGGALSLLGFGGLAALGSGLGRLMWRVVPSRRRLAVKNMMQHLQLSEDRATELAAESFRHSARSFLEILHNRDFGIKSPRFGVNRPDLWKAMCETQRPVVAASAHIGAWELIAPLLGEIYADPRPRLMVVRRYPDPAIQAFITAHRETKGARMVGHRTVASAVLRALRQNGMVGFLVDHNALRSEALFLPFLGEEAAVNMGPALLAVRANALIWPAFLLRDGKNYVFDLQDPLDTATLEGSREEKVRAAALFYTQAVERVIRENPSQWFWMHNRWKTRPAMLPANDER